MFDLLMPSDEIIALYKDAKDKKKQISILADMNCTTTKEMRNWLIAQGMSVPEDKRFKDTNVPEQKEVPPIPVTEEINKPEVPESICKILNERRIHLIAQIKKLQSEVNDINDFIGDYRKE